MLNVELCSFVFTKKLNRKLSEDDKELKLKIHRRTEGQKKPVFDIKFTEFSL